MKAGFGQTLNLLLIGSAIVAGWWLYGWKGLVLALSVIVFWLILQFNRAARVLRNAGQVPVGHLDSVVMLQSKLNPGMTMAEVIALTGSLGVKLHKERDDWQWTDVGGDEIVVYLRRGVVVRWAVARKATEEEPTTAP